MHHIVLREVILDWDLPTCRNFSTDAFVASFGNVDRMEPAGFDWNDWFARKVAAFPEGNLLALRGAIPVGHISLDVELHERTAQFHLLYVIPEERGSGVADQLHDYALALCARFGVQRASLNVSPSNLRAVHFYRRHSWIDLGPRPGHEYVHVMELRLA